MKVCIGRTCTDATLVFVFISMFLAYIYYTSNTSVNPIINVTIPKEEKPSSSIFQDRLTNKLLEPEKTYIPINVRTRGGELPYQQYGFVFQNDIRIPLFGRQQYSGSNKYDYYVQDESRNFIKIPLTVSGDRELYDGDTVKIDSYDGDFIVKIYENDTPRYIPHL